MKKEVFILGGARTPMGEYGGALRDLSAIELGAIAARAALERSGVAPEAIDHTVIGNALQTSGDAIYGARHVALKAGVPFDRPALTVNRLCGSGIQSIISAAHMIQLGEARACLAGGMESMSQAPHVIRGARSGFALGQGKLEDSLMVALLDTYCNTPMAGTAENLARKFEISREEQDKYALRSQQETKRAKDAGIFAEEIVPDPAIGLFYGHLSTAPGSFLREMLLYTYHRQDVPDLALPPLAEVSSAGLRRLIFNLSKEGALFSEAKWYAEKELEHRFESCTVSEILKRTGEACGLGDSGN